jgi:redox-sensitive bicupin YhaK (pirin superfamily)
MNPQNFSWLPTKDGCFTKELGSFTEFRTTIGMVKVPPRGSHTLSFDSRIALVMVVSGRISVGDDELQVKDAMRLDRGETQTVSSVDGAELLYFGLPDIAPESASTAGVQELTAAP